MIQYDRILELEEEVRVLRNELECANAKLVGCSLAAIGCMPPSIADEYNSVALQDVLDLRDDYEKLLFLNTLKNSKIDTKIEEILEHIDAYQIELKNILSTRSIYKHNINAVNELSHGFSETFMLDESAFDNFIIMDNTHEVKTTINNEFDTSIWNKFDIPTWDFNSIKPIISKCNEDCINIIDIIDNKHSKDNINTVDIIDDNLDNIDNELIPITSEIFDNYLLEEEQVNENNKIESEDIKQMKSLIGKLHK